MSQIVWSGEAPAGPEQQQSTGVQGQDQQVNAEQEAVELRAEGQPVGLSRGLAVLLGQGQAEGHQLLEKPLQPGGSVLDLIQGQQILLQRGLELIIYERIEERIINIDSCRSSK